MCRENETKVEVRWAWLGLTARMCWDALCSFHEIGISLPSSALLLTEGWNYSVFLAWCTCGHNPCPLQHPNTALSSAWCSQCLGFVFNALAVSPRAAAMGRGESWSMGRRGRVEGLRMQFVVSWLLILAGGGSDAPFRMSGCVHSPLFSLRDSKGWDRVPCNLLVKMLWILSFKVYFFLRMKVSEHY